MRGWVTPVPESLQSSPAETNTPQSQPPKTPPQPQTPRQTNASGAPHTPSQSAPESPPAGSRNSKSRPASPRSPAERSATESTTRRAMPPTIHQWKSKSKTQQQSATHSASLQKFPAQALSHQSTQLAAHEPDSTHAESANRPAILRSTHRSDRQRSKALRRKAPNAANQHAVQLKYRKAATTATNKKCSCTKRTQARVPKPSAAPASIRAARLSPPSRCPQAALRRERCTRAPRSTISYLRWGCDRKNKTARSKTNSQHRSRQNSIATQTAA